MPPLKGGVLAGTALFSLATVVAFGGERVNFLSRASGAWSKDDVTHVVNIIHTEGNPILLSYFQQINRLHYQGSSKVRISIYIMPISSPNPKFDNL